MKISLIGYMGSGKSVVGEALSKLLGTKFIDLDSYIETQENKSISEIFKQRGELYFRKKESAYLQEILTKDEYILSTGGGTPIFYNHMELINQRSTSYYLYASPTTLSERLASEKRQRPLIAHLTEENLPEFIAKHLFERNPMYHLAHHTIDTNGKAVEAIVNEIITIQSQT